MIKTFVVHIQDHFIRRDRYITHCLRINNNDSFCKTARHWSNS